jgi:UDP-N-acetylmuramoyl-tripeptide--D-alanyl-D-alanine ligase
MKPLTLAEIRRTVGGRSTQALPAVVPSVSAICTDTRQMKPNSLFVALCGETFDGHRYLTDAAAGGAIAAVVSSVPENAPPSLQLIVVPDTRIALGKLGALVRKGLRCKVIAVAGSNGKTSTKRLIDGVLATKLKGSYSPKSFNNDIGVPLAIFAAESGHDYLILEIGTNHPGEISNLTKIARPDIAVLTNCSAEHLEFLQDLAGVRRENAAIIEALHPRGLLIVNADDPLLLDAVAAYPGNKITFGFGSHNDLFPTDLHADETGVRFLMNGRVPISVPLLGKHTAVNALAAIAVGMRFRISESDIVAGLSVAKGPEMRLQLDRFRDITLLNDAYNANPASMKAALETLQSLPTQGRRIAVLGDMRELGVTSDRLHEEVGEFAARCNLDELVCIGNLGRLIAETARRVGMAEDRVRLFPDAASAAQDMPHGIAGGDIVLIKASRGIGLEVLAKAIKENRSKKEEAHAEPQSRKV